MLVKATPSGMLMKSPGSRLTVPRWETRVRVPLIQRGRCVLQGPSNELRQSLDEIERSYLAGPVEVHE
jgi:hypothetical protein